jgi:hypothetical protein
MRSLPLDAEASDTLGQSERFAKRGIAIGNSKERTGTSAREAILAHSLAGCFRIPWFVIHSTQRSGQVAQGLSLFLIPKP